MNLEKLLKEYDINNQYEFNNEINIGYNLSDDKLLLKIDSNNFKVENISLLYRVYEFEDLNDKVHINNIIKNLYILLNAIYKEYGKICSYEFEKYLDPDYGFGCPLIDGLEVIIDISFIVPLEIKAIKKFITLIESVDLVEQEKCLYIKNEQIYFLEKEKKTFHKKTKNIKYFFEIIRVLNNSSIPIFNSNIAFEQRLSKMKTNSKVGSIEFKKTKKLGYSVKPYVDTLKNLNILQIVNDRYILDKTAKWFLELEDFIKNRAYLPTLSPLDSKIKELHFLEKYYFLKKILTIDFQYIYEIFEIIYIVKKVSLNELSKLFQEKYIEEYSNLEYVKGVVSLRVHWLQALGILEYKREIIFTSKGTDFFNEIMKIRTLYLDIDKSINAFLLLQFTNSFSNLINIKVNKEGNTDTLIKKYLPIVFKLHINKFNKRAIFSSILNSIIVLSLIEEGNIVEYEDIKDIITNSNILNEMGYSFVYSNREQDGYIKRIQ